MRVPLQWLRDYVDVPVDAAQLAHDLTMSGTKIEAVHGAAPAAFTGVFVGRVLEVVPHPSADRLRCCRVEVGGEVLSIVCGAPNVRAGLTVAVAKIGARLPGDVKIRKSKIRGELSEGMICSGRELGTSDEASGILELDTGVASGTDFATVSGGGDVVLEAEVTPNRPDCLSMIGIAREVAAIYGGRVRLPEVPPLPARRGPAPVPVRIESAADCGRYLARVVRGITIGPSPDWLQARLRAAGLHPINNVVDITNFVLFECGQPQHAFDLATLRGPEIVVRRARGAEALRTLDGVDRKLDASILVIADAERAVALAGIMGGAGTAVQAATRDLLLESAWFDPSLVRAGRRKLGMSTDASYRFERQADIEAVQWAADRATALFVSLAGATEIDTDSDARPRPPQPVHLTLRVARSNKLIGVDLDAAATAGLLQRLDLSSKPAGDRVEVDVPSFRRDLLTEIDLVEEVARAHGYENIESRTLPPAPLIYRANPHAELLARLRDVAVGLGYYEVRTSAFMDGRDPERLQLPADDPRRRAVHIANPIVTHLDTMRTALLPGMLRVLRHNRHHDQDTLRFVQVDRVFVDLPGDLPGLPTERERCVLLASGAAAPRSWGHADRAYDLYDLKGDTAALFGQLGVDTSWVYGYTESFWDDAVSFSISGTYGVFARGGAVRDAVLREFDLEPPVFGLEIDIEALEKHLPGTPRYRALPRLPAVKRDLSVVVPSGVTWSQIEARIRARAGARLESLNCFDVFETAAGRSFGVRLRFRDPSRTLTEADIGPLLEAIVRDLADSLHVTLRAG
jgi:phenylalanyl-tRNA synthetase beta chain